MLVPCCFIRLQNLNLFLIIHFNILSQIVSNPFNDAFILLLWLRRPTLGSYDRVNSLSQHEVRWIFKDHVCSHRALWASYRVYGSFVAQDWGYLGLVIIWHWLLIGRPYIHDFLAQITREHGIPINWINIHISSINTGILIICHILLSSLMPQNQIECKDFDKLGITNHEIGSHIEN